MIDKLKKINILKDCHIEELNNKHTCLGIYKAYNDCSKYFIKVQDHLEFSADINYINDIYNKLNISCNKLLLSGRIEKYDYYIYEFIDGKSLFEIEGTKEEFYNSREINHMLHFFLKKFFSA